MRVCVQAKIQGMARSVSTPPPFLRLPSRAGQNTHQSYEITSYQMLSSGAPATPGLAGVKTSSAHQQLHIMLLLAIGGGQDTAAGHTLVTENLAHVVGRGGLAAIQMQAEGARSALTTMSETLWDPCNDHALSMPPSRCQNKGRQLLLSSQPATPAPNCC